MTDHDSDFDKFVEIDPSEVRRADRPTDKPKKKLGPWDVDRSKLPAAIFSALGISLILAYNRGQFDKIDWRAAWASPDWWGIFEIGAFLVVMAGAYVGLIKLSYWIWPGRGD